MGFSEHYARVGRGSPPRSFGSFGRPTGAGIGCAPDAYRARPAPPWRPAIQCPVNSPSLATICCSEPTQNALTPTPKRDCLSSHLQYLRNQQYQCFAGIAGFAEAARPPRSSPHALLVTVKTSLGRPPASPDPIR